MESLLLLLSLLLDILELQNIVNFFLLVDVWKSWYIEISFKIHDGLLGLGEVLTFSTRSIVALLGIPVKRKGWEASIEFWKATRIWWGNVESIYFMHLCVLCIWNVPVRMQNVWRLQRKVAIPFYSLGRSLCSGSYALGKPSLWKREVKERRRGAHVWFLGFLLKAVIVYFRENAQMYLEMCSTDRYLPSRAY